MPLNKLNIDPFTINQIPFPVVLHDGTTVFLTNTKFKKITANNLKESKNLKVYFEEKSIEKLKIILSTKKEIETTLKFKDKGEISVYNSISSPVTYNDKVIIQTVLTNHNEQYDSKEIIKKISEHNLNVIYYLDFSSKHKLQFISESSKDIIGIASKELYNDFNLFKKRVLKKDQKLVISTKEDFFKQSPNNKINKAVITLSGKKPKTLEVTSSPIFDSKKELVGLLGKIRDITQSSEAELALIETKNKFDLITNYSNDIIAFYTFSPKPKYLYVSPNIKNILGYSPEELLNKPNFFEDRLVGSRDKFLHHTKALRTNQKNKIKKNIHFSFNILNNLEESVWLENNLVPIINSNGKIDFYINIIRDITEQKTAQLEVENQYMNYRNLLDHSPAAYIIHHHGTCLYLNQALLDILKYKNKSDLLGSFVIDLFDEKDRQKAINRINEIYKTGGTGNKITNYHVRDKSGNIVEVEIKSGFIKFNNKDCVISLVDNVSKRRLVEKEKLKTQVTALANVQLQKEINDRLIVEKNLREKTAHLSAIFESSSHLIWSVNDKYELTSFNQNFYKIVKQNHNIRVKIGIKVDELITSNREEYINYWYPKYAQVFAGNKINFEKEESHDGVLFRRVFINPVYNSSNVVSEISCIANDITESKNYERKLLNQSGKLSAIFDSSHHYIWSIDREGKLTSFNKNYYDLVTSIYNTKPYLGLVLNRGVLANDIEYNEHLKFHYDKAFSGLATSFEIETRDKDLKNVHLEIFFNPIYQNEEVVEVSGIAHNITEKKLVQQRIELSLKEKEVLLKEVHHRVKNNMQVISSILNLQSSYVSDEYALTLLKESQNRIKTMAYIHESLYQNKSFTSVNFSEYVQTLINNIIQSYTHSSDKIKMKFNIEPLKLSLDASIPAGLIINELVTNAIKHAFPHPKSGTITFNLGYKNNFVILELKDNGVGFGPEVDFANSHSLGLQLVNTLIEQLDAKLKFKSQKGIGTEVSVIFKL